MSLVGKIQSLFLDREKTQPIFPITKVKAVSDDNGKGLNVLLDDKASKDFVTAKIAEAQLGGGGGEIDLSGFATKDDLNVVNDKIPTTPEQIGAHPNTWMPTASDVGAAPAGHVTDKNNPHGVTPEQIGAVNKNGDTMTGALTTTRFYVNPGEGGYPTFEFQAGTVRSAFVQQDIRDGKRNVGFYLYQSDQDDNATKYYTCYNLPAPLTGQTANKVYDILTTKSPISVAQGGTGATDAETARANLGAAPAGYGLGGTPKTGAAVFSNLSEMGLGLTASCTTEAFVKALKGHSNVQFTHNKSDVIRLTDVPFNYGTVEFHKGSNDHYIYGIGVDFNGNIYVYNYHPSHTDTNGWYYDNPPMTDGVEYRTTERYNGRVVYAKLVNMGKLTAGGVTKVDVSLGSKIIRYAANNDWAGVPMDEETGYEIRVKKVCPTYIEMFSGASNTNATAHVLVWYIK